MIIDGKTIPESALRPPVLSLDEIYRAEERIKSLLEPTPCRLAKRLSHKLGYNVYLKLENLHETGSFKERGAANALANLSQEQSSAGIIAASAGNHAQAVARHATKLGITSHIVMPLSTPLIKTSRTAQFGGNVILHGESFDDALAHALYLKEKNGYTFLPPFDHPDVISGQGVAGLEILKQLPDVGTLLVPIGGGGLISGIATAAKSINPDIKVIGIEPTGAASMTAALKAGHPYAIPHITTIAEGVAVRRVGELNFNLVKHYVDEIVTVTEPEIAAAILFLLEEEKSVVEGAGAISVAALLNQKVNTDTSKPVCAVISGGNIDVSTIARVIDRGLVNIGRLYRVTLEIQDAPGTLLKVLKMLEESRVNVLEVVHERKFNISEGFGKTNIQLQLETRGEEHIREIVNRLSTAGYPVIDHL